jgi:hypothetical protein
MTAAQLILNTIGTAGVRASYLGQLQNLLGTSARPTGSLMPWYSWSST